MRVICPILLGLLDPQAAAHKELKRADKGRAENVADVAARALEVVGKALAWPHYQQLLLVMLKKVRLGGEDRLRVHVRALTALLDGFHFDIS